MIAPRRRDNGPPEVVEIVLDRPLPRGARTRFRFDDGVIVNVRDYITIDGDADADGDRDLSDLALLQTASTAGTAHSTTTPRAATST